MPDRVSSGAPWETQIGYCRAIRSGSHIAVSGTASIGSEGQIVGVGDSYAQTQRCLCIIETCLRELGASMSDVVRTRIFVTCIEDWPSIGKAHAEAFGEHPPATSMVEVSRLIDSDLLVEIEADALVRT